MASVRFDGPSFFGDFRSRGSGRGFLLAGFCGLALAFFVIGSFYSHAKPAALGGADGGGGVGRVALERQEDSRSVMGDRLDTFARRQLAEPIDVSGEYSTGVGSELLKPLDLASFDRMTVDGEFSPQITRHVSREEKTVSFHERLLRTLPLSLAASLEHFRQVARVLVGGSDVNATHTPLPSSPAPSPPGSLPPIARNATSRRPTNSTTHPVRPVSSNGTSNGTTNRPRSGTTIGPTNGTNVPSSAPTNGTNGPSSGPTNGTNGPSSGPTNGTNGPSSGPTNGPSSAAPTNGTNGPPDGGVPSNGTVDGGPLNGTANGEASSPLPAAAVNTSAVSSGPNTTRPADHNDFTTAPGPDYGNYTARPTSWGQPRNDTPASASGPQPDGAGGTYSGHGLPVVWTPPPESTPPAPAYPTNVPGIPSASAPSVLANDPNNPADDPDNVLPNPNLYNTTWLNITYPVLGPDGRPLFSLPRSMFAEVELPNGSTRGVPRTKHPLPYLPRGQQPHFIVAKDGSGDFTEIQDAIDAVPWDPEIRHVILIKPGVYVERLWIPKKKPFISLIGWDPLTTIISFNLTADITTPDGQPIKTYFTPSVIVEGRGFIARSITIKNDAPRAPFGSIISQAVAIRVTADQSAFYDCIFIGWQDTLYAHKGRQYYENCHIWGAVDFIFGNAAALFNSCSLLVRGSGWLTAQSRKFPENRTGFLFYGGSVTRSPDADVTIGSLLGRPWGFFSQVIFANVFLDDFILGEGWGRWLDRELHASYGEFNTSGPGSYGANSTFRVPFGWNLSEAEVRPFLGQPNSRPGFDFIMGDLWMEVPPNIPPPPPPPAPSGPLIAPASGVPPVPTTPGAPASGVPPVPTTPGAPASGVPPIPNSPVAAIASSTSPPLSPAPSSPSPGGQPGAGSNVPPNQPSNAWQQAPASVPIVTPSV